MRVLTMRRTFESVGDHRSIVVLPCRRKRPGRITCRTNLPDESAGHGRQHCLAATVFARLATRLPYRMNAPPPPPERLADLVRQLEGSTHGGPRHAMLFDSLKTEVGRDPSAALDAIEFLPTSARSVLLMVVSGLGRRMLPEILKRLTLQAPEPRRDAAMILCIWATRGLLYGGDRESIETAYQSMTAGERDEPTEKFIQNALQQIRT